MIRNIFLVKKCMMVVMLSVMVPVIGMRQVNERLYVSLALEIPSKLITQREAQQMYGVDYHYIGSTVRIIPVRIGESKATGSEVLFLPQDFFFNPCKTIAYKNKQREFYFCDDMLKSLVEKLEMERQGERTALQEEVNYIKANMSAINKLEEIEGLMKTIQESISKNQDLVNKDFITNINNLQTIHDLIIRNHKSVDKDLDTLTKNQQVIHTSIVDGTQKYWLAELLRSVTPISFCALVAYIISYGTTGQSIAIVVPGSFFAMIAYICSLRKWH